MKKKTAIIVIVIVILQYFSNFVFAESDDETTNTVENETTSTVSEEVEELEEQKEEITTKIGKSNVQLEYVQGELSDTLIQLQETEDQIAEYEQEIEEQQEQIEELTASIEELTANLALATQDYNEKKELLAKRLVALYEAGDTEYLDVLLKSSDILDFLSRYYIIEEMAEYDTTLINKVKEEKENIETTTKQLAEQQNEITELKAENEKISIVLANMQTLQSTYYEQLTDEEKELQEEITAYKEEQEEIEEQILAATNTSVDIQYTGGEMLWPVAASGTVITSNYGIRQHPIQGVIKVHTGLDIGGASTGTAVVAALDGVVTYAGWLGGYGNCVMISHGDGVVTLYGHGNEILTEVGAEVKQGDTIMTVGSTGNSTGPHLHFEVRIDGECVDPLDYVNVPE